MRKALQTEQGKGDMEGRIGTLEAETKDFERQVCHIPGIMLTICESPLINGEHTDRDLHCVIYCNLLMALVLQRLCHFKHANSYHCQQVAEWKLKCEAIEKREAERREVDAKKHKEEVAFLENHGERCMTSHEAHTNLSYLSPWPCLIRLDLLPSLLCKCAEILGMHCSEAVEAAA